MDGLSPRPTSSLAYRPEYALDLPADMTPAPLPPPPHIAVPEFESVPQEELLPRTVEELWEEWKTLFPQVSQVTQEAQKALERLPKSADRQTVVKSARDLVATLSEYIEECKDRDGLETLLQLAQERYNGLLDVALMVEWPTLVAVSGDSGVPLPTIEARLRECRGLTDCISCWAEQVTDTDTDAESEEFFVIRRINTRSLEGLQKTQRHIEIACATAVVAEIRTFKAGSMPDDVDALEALRRRVASFRQSPAHDPEILAGSHIRIDDINFDELLVQLGEKLADIENPPGGWVRRLTGTGVRDLHRTWEEGGDVYQHVAEAEALWRTTPPCGNGAFIKGALDSMTGAIQNVEWWIRYYEPRTKMKPELLSEAKNKLTRLKEKQEILAKRAELSPPRGLIFSPPPFDPPTEWARLAEGVNDALSGDSLEEVESVLEQVDAFCEKVAALRLDKVEDDVGGIDDLRSTEAEADQRLEALRIKNHTLFRGIYWGTETFPGVVRSRVWAVRSLWGVATGSFRARELTDGTVEEVKNILSDLNRFIGYLAPYEAYPAVKKDLKEAQKIREILEGNLECSQLQLHPVGLLGSMGERVGLTHLRDRQAPIELWGRDGMPGDFLDKVLLCQTRANKILTSEVPEEVLNELDAVLHISNRLGQYHASLKGLSVAPRSRESEQLDRVIGKVESKLDTFDTLAKELRDRIVSFWNTVAPDVDLANQQYTVSLITDNQDELLGYHKSLVKVSKDLATFQGFLQETVKDHPEFEGMLTKVGEASAWLSDASDQLSSRVVSRSRIFASPIDYHKRAIPTYLQRIRHTTDALLPLWEQNGEVRATYRRVSVQVYRDDRSELGRIDRLLAKTTDVISELKQFRELLTELQGDGSLTMEPIPEPEPDDPTDLETEGESVSFSVRAQDPVINTLRETKQALDWLSGEATTRLLDLLPARPAYATSSGDVEVGRSCSVAAGEERSLGKGKEREG